jgi:hypothetical protein
MNAFEELSEREREREREKPFKNRNLVMIGWELRIQIKKQIS